MRGASRAQAARRRAASASGSLAGWRRAPSLGAPRLRSTRLGAELTTAGSEGVRLGAELDEARDRTSVRHSAFPELHMPLAVERSDDARIWLALCEGEEALLRSTAAEQGGRQRWRSVRRAACICARRRPSLRPTPSVPRWCAVWPRSMPPRSARSAARATPPRSRSASASGMRNSGRYCALWFCAEVQR